MILKRVYKVPNELKKLLQLIFLKFHDFSGIRCLAYFWSIGGIIVSLQRYIVSVLKPKFLASNVSNTIGKVHQATGYEY